MDPETKEKTLEKLTKAKSILISVDEDSGLDGLASGLALLLSFQKLQKTVSLIAKTPSVGDASQLYGVSKINKETTGKNLVIVINNAVKNVDKVTYFLENNKLKIVIHALADSNGVSPDEINYEHQEQSPDLIFLIGERHSEKVNIEITPEQVKTSDIWIVNIAKNKMENKFAHLALVDKEAASLSELTTLIFQELALPMDEDISYNLYTGISNATQKFSASHAKSQTFRSAEWLIKFGAGHASFAEDNDAYPKRATVNEFSNSSQIPVTSVAQPGEIQETPIEQVERKEATKEEWLKPPKIYKGGKSFDSGY